MKKNLINKVLTLLMVLAVIGFGTDAFARGGKGACPFQKGHGQNAQVQGNYGCPAYAGTLSDEDRQKVNEACDAFYTATKELRQSIDEKETALRAELAKEETDLEIATGLQKEISDLGAQFAQKRLEHFIKLKSVNPKFGQTFQKGNQVGCAGRYGAGCPRGGGYGGCPWR